MRVGGTDIPTKFTLYFAIVYSYSIAVSIVLYQLAHSITFFNPRDDADLIAYVCD